MRMTIRTMLAFLAAAVLSCTAARGAETIETKEGEGFGPTREAAIQDALLDGIRQVKGAVLKTTGNREISVGRSSETVDGHSRHRTSTTSESERSVSELLNGAVKGYDIISCTQEPNGEWHAVLDVQVVQYETPGLSPDTRRKLVVAPFDSVPAGFSVTGRQVSAQEITGSFRDRLETQLVQSRRFAVLGRQDTDAILREKKLILSESTDPGEYAKIGATLGTDYIVCGKVSGLEVDKGTVQSPFTDAVLPQIRSARIALNYRILVMPTAQIKWAGEVDIDLDPDHCLELGGDETAACDALLDAAARAVCAQALGNIYPVRAVKLLDGGEVVLNQGGTLLWEGETFDVFRLGEPIIDPYTHEMLGRDESRIATIQVLRVDAKLSYARVLDGTIPAEAVAANRVVCRPPRLGFAVPAPAEEPAIKPPTATTGVRLPFD